MGRRRRRDEDSLADDAADLGYALGEWAFTSPYCMAVVGGLCWGGWAWARKADMIGWKALFFWVSPMMLFLAIGFSAGAVGWFSIRMFIQRKPRAGRRVLGADGGGAPFCPRCGVRMVMRKATRGRDLGRSFWGCANFPQCREIIDIR